MTMTKYNLTPVGYLLLQDAELARSSNDYNRALGLYCGVDRLPAFTDIDRHCLPKTTAMGQAAIEKVATEWYDARSGATAFLANPVQASDLIKGFHAVGIALDLVYCQLAWRLGQENTLKQYTLDDSGPPRIALTYGFDVSWPTCNHSAIRQPGVVPTNPMWRSRLNEWGVLNNYEDAEELRKEYLEVYPYPPFDIFLVHKVIL